MRAFRNIGGSIVEVEVDFGLDNQPILPPDTTVDAKPEATAGHYVTVVGNSWVQIPIAEEVVAFEYQKQKAMAKLSTYKEYLLEQPITHDSVSFDADEKARARLTQALVINTASSYLPPAWIAADNSSYALADLAALMGIVTAVQTAFATRFFEMDAIRQAITAATNEAELNAVVIPTVPNQM